ncbi:HlyD family efflux transporter periplasmic adaptor subunit [Pseudoluteimonas lycopersici]|uniref:HlyD family efflux transporter periplasmic adaptor subunit n=1 Tax=Pseudoluteimonas lycopersici TaxID=1324796 RepID=UPI001FE989E0|nr:HlyD family efflux transporter periplasmic adaptor subunit [Lysobacter lycopersici]
MDAELALVDASAAEETAAIDAALPRELLQALDYDKYQGEYERTKREHVLARAKLADAVSAIAQRREDGGLEVRKLELQLGYFQAQVDTATVVARRDGTVVHAFQNGPFGGDGGRYEEGSTAFPGTVVGQVVASAGGYGVRAWALEPDRAGLKPGQPVRLEFDALPGQWASGRIKAISGASAAKPEWGDGRYFSVDISLDGGAVRLPMLPGMSVRVDTDTTNRPVPTMRMANKPIMATGEIIAKRTIAILPPQIEGLWQLNITQMAGDGSQVRKGQPIVVFAGGDLMQQLPSKQSELAEKQRIQEKLRLELADKAREAALATAQAIADADKAARKARQPKEYIAGVEYRKLLIDRDRTARKRSLAKQRELVAARDRSAEQRAADAEVDQLKREVARIQASLAQLSIAAPRDGILLHHSSWNGDKIDTGSQVWRGISVADIPDMKTLAVRASLSERDLRRVREGQTVAVVLGGAGRRVAGTISGVGNSVHSKSRAENIPVVDLDIELASLDGLSLKPGQPVRVEIPVATGSRAASK